MQQKREELDKWLNDLGFATTNLHQRYADATEMAKLLKRLYPRRVELHNYSACSSTVFRMNNWTTLNSKVLAKLKLFQPKTSLEDLANAAPGAIEQLLHKIMQKKATAKLNKIGGNKHPGTGTISDEKNANADTENTKAEKLPQQSSTERRLKATI